MDAIFIRYQCLGNITGRSELVRQRLQAWGNRRIKNI